jgi:crossover junction endodeoxyribonuclease RusA
MTLFEAPTLGEVKLFVPGQAAPQGSKSPRRNKHSGTIQMVESSKKVKPWREDIRADLARHCSGMRFEQGVPVTVHLTFVMRRVSGMPKTSRGRATPPHTKQPDLDKLARAVLDAITSAGVWHDDGQVNKFGTLEKRYAEIGETPGVYIHLQAGSSRP